MKIIKPGSTIGIIGGGQLGRMAASAASSLGYHVHIYTDKDDSPASHVTDKTITASYTDKKALHKFASHVDVVTFEFENIPHESVKVLEEHVPVRPSWKVLHVSQNRLREKDFINSIGIKTAPYKKIKSAKDLRSAHKEIATRCILKTVEMGYDGKGQFIIDDDTDYEKLWDEINIGTGVLEGMVKFTKEISVIIARGIDGKSECFPPSHNIHKGGILDTSVAPADISDKLSDNAKKIAEKIANELDLIGMIAVEMFITENEDILVNEIAPRPHNSGHWTMDGAITSQFEQFIRAVCGLPLGNPAAHSKVEMQNLIGEDVNSWEELIKNPNNKIHLYGKKKIAKGRKMGHVNKIITSFS